MSVSIETSDRNVWTAQDKLRKAKNSFLRLRKTSDQACVRLADKRRRAIQRDIPTIDQERLSGLRGFKFNA